ncbi:uncharacterized protein LOC105849144 [Hydra vulgaris]|uniref:uncharacterized protein LOC105849144 n=1 Tax=Hydra vulgaris TaxID=6087 RepID=UPI0006410EC2|nr:uncharacterized protein LOC105849144 [Hydra vulgaris]
MFEKLIRDTILKHLVSNRLISEEQTGFVPNKSCTTNLSETIDTITFETAKGKPLCVIYLDFAKAFDKVEHKRLLTKIKAYGITGKIYNWIESFLANRKQRVAISNTFVVIPISDTHSVIPIQNGYQLPVACLRVLFWVQCCFYYS